MREMKKTELSNLSAGCGLVRAADLSDATKDQGHGDPKPIEGGDDDGSGSNTGIDVVVNGGNNNGLYNPFPG
jgi:hypothetical protein